VVGEAKGKEQKAIDNEELGIRNGESGMVNQE